MLAVARAAGETAPLLFTALFSDYWPHAAVHGADRVARRVDLRLLGRRPFPNQIEIAWAASLVLVVLVLVANIAAPVVTSRRTQHR